MSGDIDTFLRLGITEQPLRLFREFPNGSVWHAMYVVEWPDGGYSRYALCGRLTGWFATDNVWAKRYPWEATWEHACKHCVRVHDRLGVAA